MSIHNINVLEKNRIIIICGIFRIEIFVETKFVEFCPICGENLEIETYKKGLFGRMKND